METIKAVCVGYGFLGKWHAQKLRDMHKNVQLVAIVEVDTSKYQFLKQEFPGVLITDQLELAISETQPQVAFIVSPTSTHAAAVKIAMGHGLHLFCEKPLFEQWDDYLENQEKTGKYQKVIQVGHIERFQSVWSLLREKKLESYITQSHLFKSARFSVFKGRAQDVDAEVDQMIHDIDLLLWLWKPQIVDVHAHSLSQIKTLKRDYVQVSIDCGKQKLAVLECGRVFHKETRKVEFIGEDGSLEIDFLKRKVLLYKSDGVSVEFEFPQVDQILEEQKSFFRAITVGSQPEVSFSDALAAHNILRQIDEKIKKAQ